jgi:hypothetical protein
MLGVLIIARPLWRVGSLNWAIFKVTDSVYAGMALPFDRRSLINETARAADGAPDFSQRIRASLPTMPH